MYVSSFHWAKIDDCLHYLSLMNFFRFKLNSLLIKPRPMYMWLVQVESVLKVTQRQTSDLFFCLLKLFLCLNDT